ncbi:homoserine dehydrogenase [Puniceicoccaceae bacterium K14]|nr:homoserine dehydrogenase [Puniceicoccaceae bacterium K14]
MSERVIKIGLCGFGVVGQGVFNHVQAKAKALTDQLGAQLEITRIAVRDTKKARDFAVADGVVCDDPMSIAQDESLDVVCELMGGTTLALEVCSTALKSGKVVITANKALLCDYGPELLKAAKDGGGHLLFEASVAGGIPIIKAINEGLVINSFSSIYGILNGTCNYILTRMANEGLSYEEILKDAKDLGYAEADETLDVQGIDAAHKAVVLAYLAYGRWVPYKDLFVEGVTKVTQDDIAYAKENGYGIKLVAVIAKTRDAGKLYITVLPTLVPLKYVLGRVDGVFNAVSVRGDVVGETVYIGPGAGRDATASAVISDLVDAVKTLVCSSKNEKVPVFDPVPRCGCDMELAEPEEIESRYYLRLLVQDEPGVLAEVASRLAAYDVSLASVSQKEVAEDASQASLILTTHMTTEKAILDAIKNLEGYECVDAKPFMMPIGNFED